MPNRYFRYLTGAKNVVLKPLLVRDRPLHIILENTTVCPFDCIMCSRSKEVLDPHHMEFSRFKKIIDDVRPLHVYLSAAGEPLLHPEQPKMIRYATEQGCRVCVVTTLAALAFPVEELVRSGLDLIKVSIDGSTAETYRNIRGTDFFPRVLKYIANINELKKKLGQGKPFLRFQFVVQKANYREAAGVVRLAHEHGVDAVFFKPLEIERIEERVDHLIGGIDYNDLKANLEEARKESRKLGVRTNLDDFLRYLLPNYWKIYKGDPSFRPLSKQCIIPWFSVVVRIHGDVGFCCYAKIEDAKVGNLFKEDFASIWKGERYRKMRAELRRGDFAMPKCAFCVPQRLSHLLDYRKVVPGYGR
jgi:MoaA/NifB/PqqE/SkfB family radical SAM enzyme